MIEELNLIATADCEHCGTKLSLYIGDLTGENWYHAQTGQRYCPQTKLAVPKMNTYHVVHSKEE